MSDTDDTCPATPAGYDFLLCFEPWTISNDYSPRFRGVGVMRRTMFGMEGGTVGIVSLGGSFRDNQSSRVKGNAQTVVWSPNFQLQTGPKIPEENLPTFKEHVRKRIHENVTKILKAVGLLTEVEPNELARSLSLVK